MTNWKPKFTKPKVYKRADGSARIVRARYSSAESGSWWTLRAEVTLRDGGKCKAKLISGKFCGQPAVDVHHIVPISRGGQTVKSNLISLCKDCHAARHSHMRR